MCVYIDIYVRITIPSNVNNIKQDTGVFLVFYIGSDRTSAAFTLPLNANGVIL